MKLNNVIRMVWLVVAGTGAGYSAGAADANSMPMQEDAGPAGESSTVQGQGVVQTIDAESSTITLSHEPIPELKWPAMTMQFKLAQGLGPGISAGQKVVFDLSGSGMNAIITRIIPLE